MQTTLSPQPGRATSARSQVSSRSAQRIVSRAITAEVPIETAPVSLLRPNEENAEVKIRFEKMIRDAQNSICAAVEAVDGCKFREDAWTRAEGGGGISRVLQDGNVFEKAGVNVSVVYGAMPPSAFRAATERKVEVGPNAPRVPFFAAGISSVMHPKNPHAPTMHFNYRYFETAEWQGIEPQWWFGGGTDITPSYVYDEDMKHFHGLYKTVCDKHDPEYYHKFRKWADDYFVINHRGERRGLGGIFFDDQNGKDPHTIMDFSEECANTVVPAYLPLVEKRMNQPFSKEEKEWQSIRRGRYVEFNLVYDRGTTFGLKTGGRIESILMSLPLQARWEYDHEPAPGTAEARLLQFTRNPVDWTA